jgi:hypothetical protein
MSALLLPILLLVMDGNQSPTGGTIVGTVVNGSRDGEPLADAEVQLRAGVGGMLEPVELTKTDRHGNFRFQNLPLSSAIVYLPGANRDGVHYPGQRLQLHHNNEAARVRIVAFDAVQEPSPLLASRHDIEIELEHAVMKVIETIIVSNPSRTTYIGKPQGERGSVTLRLTIPESFDRVTFSREFFGRRFQIIDHRLVTELPWTPGDTELQFAYRIPLEGHGAGRFRRPLDVPASNLRVRVKGSRENHVSSNLSQITRAAKPAIFSAFDSRLPAGYVVELQIGEIPLPWMRYARWASLFIMAALMLATLWVRRRQRLRASLSHVTSIPKIGSNHPTRRARRRAA